MRKTLLPLSLFVLLPVCGCGSRNPSLGLCDPPCGPDSICTASGCVPDTVDMTAPAAADMPVDGCAPACPREAPYCSPARVCVKCLEDANCPLGFICGSVAGKPACIAGCRDDSRCSSGGGGDGGVGQKCCDGRCIDIASDSHNCGACGQECLPNHAQPACVAGACTAGRCEGGWGDCNNDATDGCETYLRVDEANCGACGKQCSLPNAVVGCAGQCYMKACVFGFDDCNGDETDGCEQDVTKDQKNCGACGAACTNKPHAKNTCVASSCIVTSCEVGYADCDHTDGNGCEVSLNTDVNNCGRCGNSCGANLVCVNGGCTCRQCNIPNAKTKCLNLQCTFDQCMTNFDDCNNNMADGCEANLLNDAANCNGCGNVCPMDKRVCVNGVCTNVPVNPFFNSMPVSQGSVSRIAGQACGTAITVTQNNQVLAISANLRLTVQTNLKFMIFSHAGHQLLFITSPKLFQPNSGWMQSDVIQPFQLVAGQSYDIAATADQTVTYYYDISRENMNGVQSLSQNPNFQNYLAPTWTGQGGVDCGIELF